MKRGSKSEAVTGKLRYRRLEIHKDGNGVYQDYTHSIDS